MEALTDSKMIASLGTWLVKEVDAWVHYTLHNTTRIFGQLIGPRNINSNGV
jgi:hypothetical protein